MAPCWALFALVLGVPFATVVRCCSCPLMRSVWFLGAFAPLPCASATREGRCHLGPGRTVTGYWALSAACILWVCPANCLDGQWCSRTRMEGSLFCRPPLSPPGSVGHPVDIKSCRQRWQLVFFMVYFSCCNFDEVATALPSIFKNRIKSPITSLMRSI